MAEAHALHIEVWTALELVTHIDCTTHSVFSVVPSVLVFIASTDENEPSFPRSRWGHRLFVGHKGVISTESSNVNFQSPVALSCVNTGVVDHLLAKVHHSSAFKNYFLQVVFFNGEDDRVYWGTKFTVLDKVWSYLHDGHFINSFVLVDEHVLRLSREASA